MMKYILQTITGIAGLLFTISGFIFFVRVVRYCESSLPRTFWNDFKNPAAAAVCFAIAMILLIKAKWLEK